MPTKPLVKRRSSHSNWLLPVILSLGYVFLYAPIVVLTIWSFNASRLVTIWGGFSTKWYGVLFHDNLFVAAAWLSLRIAAVSATGALILGTMAAVTLTKFGQFRGRSFFTALTSAPLVMPDIILGLALLLTFVSLQQLIGVPQRGFLTITLAHITIATAYVVVVVRARLAQMDKSLEEAAMDLGARPLKIFFVITIPLISPSLIAGWLLAFTLSLDDVVVTQFLTGPGSTTLPIAVFSSIRLGVSPEINALGTIIITVVALLIVLATFLMKSEPQNDGQ